MNWFELTIEPRDVLFFRGAKPVGGSAIGEGSNWPAPSIFHHALLSAFHERWPQRQLWEHEHHRRSDETTPTTFRFGGLRTIGVFPAKGQTLYVPTPADIQCLDDTGTPCVLEPRKLMGLGDLPAPLEYGLFKPGTATKKSPKGWIAFDQLERYLTGRFEGLETVPESSLYLTEHRPGIGIDTETGAANEGGEDQGGKFYLAEYMRMNTDNGITMKAFAACTQSRIKDQAEKDVLETYFENGKHSPIVLGGQRGVVTLECTRKRSTDAAPFDIRTGQGQYLKWVLLTPAIFTGGWLPSWVHPETGAVLHYTKPPRKPGETRAEWRQRMKNGNLAQLNPIGKLVAACIPKPEPSSGWRVHGGNQGGVGAKPTRLCVPAGAVYYFKIAPGSDPAELTAFLNGQCKSDIAAEQGFGLGLCGVWQTNKESE